MNILFSLFTIRQITQIGETERLELIEGMDTFYVEVVIAYHT